jgi:CTP synthase (UTP-ammonia lyase)
MKKPITVAIIGDYQPDFEPHPATNEALAHSAAALGVAVEVSWLPTPSLERQTAQTLQPFDALWCAPGSPYQSMTGALQAIRFAREAGRPFIGT